MAFKRTIPSEVMRIASEYFHSVSLRVKMNPIWWKYTERMCDIGKRLFRRYCENPNDPHRQGFLLHQHLTAPAGIAACEKCARAYERYLKKIYFTVEKKKKE